MIKIMKPNPKVLFSSVSFYNDSVLTILIWFKLKTFLFLSVSEALIFLFMWYGSYTILISDLIQ